MWPSHRAVVLVALCTILVGYGALVDSPIIAIGGGLVGLWLVTQGIAFSNDLSTIYREIDVSQAIERSTLRPGESTTVSLTTRLRSGQQAEVHVEGRLPAVTTVSQPLTLHMDTNETIAQIDISTRWPIAGRYRLSPATVTVSNGLFQTSFDAGSTPDIMVEPASTHNLHIGMGGQRLSLAFGEHKSDRTGAGIEPASIRPYQTTDPASRIDWKVTARLAEVYVREFDVETDRKTVFLFDRRHTLQAGDPGNTKLDLLRAVGLTVLEVARRQHDPIGLATVDESGLSEHIQANTTLETYRTVRSILLDHAGTRANHQLTHTHMRQPITGEQARERLSHLFGETDTFAKQLTPFYENSAAYYGRLAERPLFDAIRSVTTSERGAVMCVILTDDHHRAELRAAVQYASRGSNTAMVFLAPSVLYREPSISSLDDAFDEYVTFETLRRSLAHIEGVTAFEVGPRDRLGTVLDSGQTRRHAEGINT